MPFRVVHSLASRMVTFSRANNLTPKTISIETVRKLYAEMRVEFAEDFEKLPESFPNGCARISSSVESGAH